MSIKHMEARLFTAAGAMTSVEELPKGKYLRPRPPRAFIMISTFFIQDISDINLVAAVSDGLLSAL